MGRRERAVILEKKVGKVYFANQKSDHVRIFAQELFPEKLREAEESRSLLLLPEVGTFDLGDLNPAFFDLHILREQEDEGWYRSVNPKVNLIVETESEESTKKESWLKLLSAPFYQPSFERGLRKVKIVGKAFGVNKVSYEYNCPLYTVPFL